MKQNQKNQILDGRIWDALIMFAVPIAFSSLLQQLFNAADQAVVGRFAGASALAAVGANTPLVALFVNVFSACSIGANALIARRIGEERRHLISQVVHTAIAFSMITGVILLFLGLIFAEVLLKMLGTPNEILPMAVSYFRIYAFAFPFALVFNFGAAILRSTGDTKRPMLALLVAGVINLILNLILVIGFRMGVSGVAIATAISNIVSCAAVLIFLCKEKTELKLVWRWLRIHKESLIQMVQIGGPAALQAAVFSVANVSIQSGINSLGSDAVAGSAIVGNIEAMAYFIVNSFSQAATTFCGQNYGANQKARCKKILFISLFEAMLGSAIFDITIVIFRYPVIHFFSDVPGVVAAADTKIMILISLQYLICLYEIIGAALRGMGRSLVPAMLTVVGSVAFRITWLFTIFRVWHTLPVLFAVYPISWVLTAALTWGYFLRIRKKL